MNQHLIDGAELAALTFYAQHRGEHLDADSHQLVERCTDHLAQAFAITTRAAQDVAMRTFSSLDASEAQAFIDIERCSSRMVIVRDTQRGTVHMVSISELARYVRERDPPAPSADTG